MNLVEKLLKRFTFTNHSGRELTMNATHIHSTVMKNSQESDYNWIASAVELVKLCQNQSFPRKYAVDIEIAILNCFANIEHLVSCGGDKYVDEEGDVIAQQYCYEELGSLAQSTINESLKTKIMKVRTRYLKTMISSAVNVSLRGCYIYNKAYGKLKEEVAEKFYNDYSVQEDLNIQDMYNEVLDSTSKIFREAYDNGLLEPTEEEKNEIASIFRNIDI